jgi:NADH-quinone oxidoreductase subunit N
LGGIPPTAGFFGKFFIFKAAVDSGLWWLAMIGIVNAFIALYYYMGVIKVMYLYRSDEEEIMIPDSRAAKVGLGIAMFGIFYLGILAAPAFEWTRTAAQAFFTG